ncbi:hypothetical protein TNCV_5099301 [Trichonephila clavipes]|uniref:Uncharacterized protein n=1 Tax=Trichonephila clavipes TaxID=2585209 RepID=A0A8X6RVX1_TRICX|nr:hypothetical protein TNCV_5099301 [Trichonephila clavipes]
MCLIGYDVVEVFEESKISRYFTSEHKNSNLRIRNEKKRKYPNRMQRLSLKSNLFLSGPLAHLISSLSYHPSPNPPPVISCSFAAPVGLGSLDLLLFCRPCRSQLISPLAPWTMMSRCTSEVFGRTVITDSWENESTMLMRPPFDAETVGDKRVQFFDHAVPKFFPSH